MSIKDESNILEGIRTGNDAVIKAFYQRNRAYVRGFILQNSGNEADVEDVFQDAMVLLYEKLKSDSLEVTASIHTYFYAVCKNIWRNRLRKTSRITTKAEPLDHSTGEEEKIVDIIDQKEREYVYQKYFIKLNQSCKKVLTLVFQGKSMKEIASVMEYSEGYARRKKFECKKSLIEMIEKDPMYNELKAQPEN